MQGKEWGTYHLYLTDSSSLIEKIVAFYFKRGSADIDYRIEIMYFSCEDIGIPKNYESVKNSPKDIKKQFNDRISKKVLEELGNRGIILSSSEVGYVYGDKTEDIIYINHSNTP